ncbi:MAG: UvrB/UvrC motif-containing protein [Clostridiales bacterium]|uniref:UvrB/UvrC motif-containing protein n=1 Tax=Clostridia TaxID=186801 RepID=UPI0018ABBD7D|nr:UvrB/UvrC motif-containing protein [Clostridium sp. 1001270J_160509_D11]MDU1203180.1 UvrB/UvrC motif-containing protein [Clostridiales bacterium]
MLCQKCNKKVATVFISTVVNGKNSQMYLCTDCAKEFHDSMSPDMQIPFPINDILSNMEFNEDTINNLIKDLKEIEDKNVVEGVNGIDNTESSQKNEEKVDITCSVCNTSFEEYKKTGKLGCSKCYSTFEKQLKPILEGIYGYSEHIGKFPKNKCKDTEVIRTVEQLKEQLNIAIQEEEYEQAAKLRDEILQLEANDI